MTIELVTGNPGAGKTTFAVATRLTAEAKRTIPLEPESCMALGVEPGTVVPRRLCVAGVKGLVLDHERLPHTLTGERIKADDIERWNAVDRDGEPLMKRLPTDPPIEGIECSLFNWWMWCKPGDLIFVDEVQYIVPRGSLGKKPPPYIALLEIHRHYGVDFIFITQHPQLLDPTIRALVGMHRHVRSVMGSSVCMVYVWDHASNPERYQLANKSTFVRKASHYELFRSAVAHVKPPASGRWGLMAIPLLLGGAAFLTWTFSDRFNAGAEAAQAASAASAPAVPADGPRAPGKGSQRALAVASAVPRIEGCWSQGETCRCLGEGGRPLYVDLDYCRVSASSFEGAIEWRPARKIEDDRPYGAAAAVGGTQERPVGQMLGL